MIKTLLNAKKYAAREQQEQSCLTRRNEPGVKSDHSTGSVLTNPGAVPPMNRMGRAKVLITDSTGSPRKGMIMNQVQGRPKRWAGHKTRDQTTIYVWDPSTVHGHRQDWKQTPAALAGGPASQGRTRPGTGCLQDSSGQYWRTLSRAPGSVRRGCAGQALRWGWRGQVRPIVAPIALTLI